jgi:hypothetical protein
MARVPYSGVQETLPDLQAPQDYQHVQASPAAFGAATAQGLQEAGQAGLKLSDFYEQTAADNAVNDYIQKSTNILRGDPQTGSTGYFQMRGADAMSAYKDTSESLDEALRETRGSLATPLAQKQFDNEARRYRAQYAGQMGEHYDQQSRVWGNDTADTSANLALSSYAQTPDDPFAFHDATEKVRQAYAKKAQLAGESTDGAVLKADQAVALTGFKALLGTDPSKANDYLDEHRDVLAGLPNYDQMVRQAKSAEIDATLPPAIDTAVTDAMTKAQLAVTGGFGVSAPASASYNIGNVKAPGGQGFLNPATPTDGVIVTANNLRNGYRGLTLQQIANKWAPRGDGNNDPVAWAKTVSQHSGIGVNQVPNLDDANTLSSLISGVGVAEKSAKDQKTFTPDVVTQGVSAALSGKHPTMAGVKAADGSQAPGTPLYPSAADALRAQMPTILENAQKFAEQKWADYPDVQERYVTSLERRLNRQVTQQDELYKVDTHVVDAALASDHAPTSEAELMAISPQVAQAWHSMQVENPYAAESIQRRFDANSHGKQTLYGSSFKEYLDRAAAGPNDPDRIGNSAQLWPYVGTGADSPLTNSGATALSELMANRGTPQGEAYVAQVRSFMDSMHANLTYSNSAMGVYDEKGEAAFAKFAAQALPVLNNAYKSGSIAKALDPKSPDYVGNMSQPFMRKPADVMNEQLNKAKALAARSMPGAPPLAPYTRQSLESALHTLDNDAQRQEALRDAVKMKRIGRDEAAQIWVAHGYPVPGGAPGAPRSGAPALQAPLPQKQTGIPGYSDH